MYKIEVGTLQSLDVTDKMRSHGLMGQRPASACKRHLGTGVRNVQEHRLVKATRKVGTIGSVLPLLVAAMQTRAVLTQLHRWRKQGSWPKPHSQGRATMGAQASLTLRPPSYFLLVHTFHLRTGGHQNYIA